MNTSKMPHLTGKNQQRRINTYYGVVKTFCHNSVHVVRRNAVFIPF